jgi:hypothetical protein
MTSFLPVGFLQSYRFATYQKICGKDHFARIFYVLRSFETPGVHDAKGQET